MRPLTSVEVLRDTGLPYDLVRFDIRIMLMTAGLVGEATGSSNTQTDISSRDEIQSVVSEESISGNRLKALAGIPGTEPRRTFVHRGFTGRIQANLWDCRAVSAAGVLAIREGISRRRRRHP